MRGSIWDSLLIQGVTCSVCDVRLSVREFMGVEGIDWPVHCNADFSRAPAYHVPCGGQLLFIDPVYIRNDERSGE